MLIAVPLRCTPCPLEVVRLPVRRVAPRVSAAIGAQVQTAVITESPPPFRIAVTHRPREISVSAESPLDIRVLAVPFQIAALVQLRPSLVVPAQVFALVAPVTAHQLLPLRSPAPTML